jgi:hypothetical protein
MGHPFSFSSWSQRIRCGVPLCLHVGLLKPFLFRCASDVLGCGGYVEKMGLEWVAADEEAWAAKFFSLAIVGGVVEFVVESVMGSGESILGPADAALRSVAAQIYCDYFPGFF